MEENITHALSMVGSVVLFIFALSCAIFAYEGLENRTEFFFELHSVTARQGDATTQLLDEDLIQRKVKFQEILMGIIEMPRYAATAGNNSNTKIKIKNSSGMGTFSVVPTTDPDTMETIYLVQLNGGTQYDVNDEGDLKELTKMVIAYTLQMNVTHSSSNLNLTSVASNAETYTFSVDYDEESITYTLNE